MKILDWELVRLLFVGLFLFEVYLDEIEDFSFLLQVRTETPSEARALDLRTQACWTDHPCHQVFHNIPGQNFEGKLNSVTTHIVEQLELRR